MEQTEYYLSSQLKLVPNWNLCIILRAWCCASLCFGPNIITTLITAITVLWAAAAALVPPMQKGNETARSLHIALNTINVLLFIWQIPTGFDIVLKVFEFTKWPWQVQEWALSFYSLGIYCINWIIFITVVHILLSSM